MLHHELWSIRDPIRNPHLVRPGGPTRSPFPTLNPNLQPPTPLFFSSLCLLYLLASLPLFSSYCRFCSCGGGGGGGAATPSPAELLLPDPLPADPFSPLPDKTALLNHYTCKTFSCFAGFKSEMGFDMRVEKSRYLTYRTDLDLPISQLLQLAKSAKSVIRLGLENGVQPVSLEVQTSSCSNSKLQPEIDEDSILKEAQIIEAKRKRIAQLSAMTSVRKIRPKSHWDYVLEKMAWSANDFAQERVWKIAAAAQIISRAAFACWLSCFQQSALMVIGVAVSRTGWSRLLGGVFFSFWVLSASAKGMMGKKGKIQTIVYLWSSLICIVISLLTVYVYPLAA